MKKWTGLSEYKLQCREPAAQSLGASGLHPTEAQIATLPHYCDPLLKLGRSENQVVYGNPSNAKDFYFEEPNKVRKPMAQHLERSFINWYLFFFLRNLVFLVVFWHFCYFLALFCNFFDKYFYLEEPIKVKKKQWRNIWSARLSIDNFFEWEINESGPVEIYFTGLCKQRFFSMKTKRR